MTLTLTRNPERALISGLHESRNVAVTSLAVTSRARPASPEATQSSKTAAKVSTRVTVQYCRLANYSPVASSLARAVQREFPEAPVVTELVPASGGVFEVSVDGKLIFSKRATYRLPDADEIFYHVRSSLARKVAS